MSTRVVATAGHVDHGKSTLVQALTGTDPDRLAEEKRRGLTIELGFAHLTTPEGVDVHLIDVPGHRRFIKTMVAGVGAIDACLLVVAATEGWRPQTEEHLRILELLGVNRGIIVLTFADRIDAARMASVRVEVAERTARTFLHGAATVAVDARDGEGIPELRAALAGLVVSIPPRPDLGRPRLWVDRAFPIAGAGTVVTGTLTGGAFAVDDVADVVGSRGTRSVRIRGLQSFGSTQAQLQPGGRAALNLAGIDHRAAARGDAIVNPNQWHLATTVDASLVVLASAARTVRGRGAYHVHLGSGEHAVGLRVLGAPSIDPGQPGRVRLRLPQPLPLMPGDRFVLRDSSTSSTVGGGEILDVDPVLPASHARPDRSVDRVIRERRWVEPDELERLTGERRTATVGRWVVDPDELQRARADIRSRVKAAPAAGLDVAALDDIGRALVSTDRTLVVEAGRVRHAATEDPFVRHPYLPALMATPFSPPSPEEAGVTTEELRELLRRRLVIREAGIVFAPEAVEQAATVIGVVLDASPQGATVSELRSALGTTRKFALALLAIMDREGRTRRRGDRRLAGPTLTSQRR